MTAPWVAGCTRALLLLARRLGTDEIRSIAAANGLSGAVAALGATAYAPAAVERDLEAAQRAVAAVVLFDLRLLLGWLPVAGRELVRTLGAWFELVNIEDRLSYLHGAPLSAVFELGAVASAWPRATAAGGSSELREALRASAWGDPGGDDPAAFHLGLRLAWARRLQDCVPETRAWVGGALALLAARDLLAGGHRVAELRTPVLRALGERWRSASTLTELARYVPPHAGWVLEGESASAEPWRLETAWWRRVGHDSEVFVRDARAPRAGVVGAAALLALDAVRVAAALAAAGVQGGAAGEVVDALL